MTTQIRRLPYGVHDFLDVRQSNFYYVDKTMFIPDLEGQARNLFFIRPRRFGKSLLLGMLEAYYDCKMKDRFGELFGDLWIGKHPTPEQGRYQVMRFDFSVATGSIDKLEQRFNSYVMRVLKEFVDKYGDQYSEFTRSQFSTAVDAVDLLTIIDLGAKSRNIPLYLIIDEYDNFTNDVLSQHGSDVYTALTHATGFYRSIFKIFKGMFRRIFITGVSPVTLDDLTSGFNIGWHITLDAKFNHLLGFSTDEVQRMIEYYKGVDLIPQGVETDAIIADMKPWYDNYCFSPDALDQSRVFNTDMVIYYLNHLINNGKAPSMMADSNARTDYGKLSNLARLDSFGDERGSIILEISEKGQILSGVEESFPAEDLVDPNVFISLLFYYGMLTIDGVQGDMLRLIIPNNSVRKLYYEYLKKQYQKAAGIKDSQLKPLFYSMAYDGDWRPALTFMAEAYKNVSSVRDAIESERNLQGFFMAYLNLTSYYLLAPELELSHGYCDFFLLPDLTRYAVRHSYIIELKTLKTSDTDARAQAQWGDAVSQINAYAQAPRVQALRQTTTLHKIIIQFRGPSLGRVEEIE